MASSTRHLAQFVGGGTQLILAIGLPSEFVMETPSMGQTLTPSGVTTGAVFGTHFVGGALTVVPVGIGSGVAFGSHLIHGGGFLFVSGIASAESIGTPTFKLLVSPLAITTLEAVGILSLRTNFYTVFYYESRAAGELTNDSLAEGRLV